MEPNTQDGTAGSDAPDPAVLRRRRSLLINHMIAYLGAMVLLVPINYATTPDRPWFVFPLVAWMAPLALHVAWAMGLFDRRR